MAQDSKRTKRERRVKRQNSLLRRTVGLHQTVDAQRSIMEQMSVNGQRLRITLLSVLAQQGGSVEITKGTVEQITESHSYEVVESPTDKTAQVVRLVTAEELEQRKAAAAEAPKGSDLVIASNDLSGDWERMREAEFGKGTADESTVADDHSHDVSRMLDEGSPNG